MEDFLVTRKLHVSHTQKDNQLIGYLPLVAGAGFTLLLYDVDPPLLGRESPPEL